MSHAIDKTTRAIARTLAAGVLLTALTALGAKLPDAQIAPWHGSPAICVDGEFFPPMTALVNEGVPRSDAEQRAYYRRLGEAGIRLFYVSASTRWRQPGDPKRGIPDGVTAACQAVRRIVESVPNAFCIMRLNTSPSQAWINAHPSEQVVFSDGSRRPVVLTTAGGKIDGMLSLCSEAWREEGARAICEFYDELEKRGEASRIIGTFLCAGGTSEWYYPMKLINPDGTYGDFSEPFRREYARFLRTKYRDEAALRRAWKRDDATFDRPLIPTPADCAFIWNADEKISRSLRDWELMSRELGVEIDLDARKTANFGTFLNYNRYAHVADFYDAWHEATARTVVHFARTIKARHPRHLVGAFYGALGCTEFFHAGTSSATLTVLNSGVVDFLAAPGTYNNREPGGVVAQREMHDSFRLRNLVYICEDDSRTHRSQPWMMRESMALYDVRDSLDTLKRDFARNICQDLQGWWFDMGNGWYDDPQILALFRRQQQIAREAFALDRNKGNEIAVIADTESQHVVSHALSQTVLDFYRTSDLSRIGAPVDYYFHNDLADPRMKDYKLYVMLNTYVLTAAEREAIYAKARRNHATVLWLYAPGLVEPQATTPLTPANVSATVGMKVKMTEGTSFPYFRVNPASHPAVAGASATRRYGWIDRDVHSNVWIAPTVLHAAYVNPGFYVEDPRATVLGRFCATDRAALACIETNGVRSVYSAAPIVRSDLLASLAAWAGCHVYSRSGDVLYANQNYVAIHAQDDGPRQIRFPRACSPWDVYAQRTCATNVTELTVTMRHGETRMWQLKK